MRAARSPDRTETTAGAFLFGALIALTQHRDAHQTADRARDRFGVLVAAALGRSASEHRWHESGPLRPGSAAVSSLPPIWKSFAEIDGAALVLVLGPALAPVLTVTGSMPVPTTVRVLAGGIRADDPRSRLV